MKVAVLTGGRSLERQVSLRSAGRVCDSLHRLGETAVSIDVGSDLVERLREERPDVVFIAMHGEQGEDGTLQELLELLGLPYTGSGPGAARRSWDKAAAKDLLRDAGIPTADWFGISQAAFAGLGAGRAIQSMAEQLEFPLVVKPARQGSALGIRFARSEAELPAALLAAFSYDDRVLLERYVHGRDLAVSVIDGPDGPEALPVVEAVPHEDDFYDFEARYSIGRTSYTCPAELPGDASDRAQRMAIDAYRTLGCRGLARVDLMLAHDGGELVVLETNTVPGFTETSLLPMAAEAAGLSFDDLVGRLVAQAAERDSSQTPGAPAPQTA